MSLYATGGTVQQIGSKRVHFFTTVGSASLVCSGTGNAEILVIAGGGAGGSDRGGGGGAGGYIYNSTYGLTAGTYSVTVGAGGVGTTSGTFGGSGTIGGNGGSSTFAALSAVGGGGGGGCHPTNKTPTSGGSGGGGSQYNGAAAGASGTAGQGFAGGTGFEAGSAGGGGGASAVGANSSNTLGGNGGNGVAYSISGASQTYCGGGGGGVFGANTVAGFNPGTGGTGGGGNGSNTGNGNAATYYGGGGGGARDANGATTTGGGGYQGIVIVSYDYTPNPFPPGPNGEAVYFSATNPSQATVTVAYNLSIPGALYRVIAYNPNGVASNPVTFTITNSLAKPAFLNPGPQTFVGGGSFSILQTAQSSGIAWTISPTTAVTLSSATDAGVTVNVSNGIAVTSPTSYTLTATDTSSQVTSQVFTIQNTFIAPAFVNPGTKSFTNGGSFSVTQTATQTGQLGWSINPTTGMTLSGASTGGVTVTVSPVQAISGVTYTLTATNPTPTSCVQSFSVTNTVTALYSFTTFTFTPIGATGANGPTSLSGYGGNYPGVGTSYALALSAGVQYWTVPITGTYNFTLAGAGSFHSGGLNSVKTGYGIVMTTSSYSLTVGQLIAILVGQISTGSTGGGGGTFIASVPNVGNLQAATAIFIAGGAGGPGGQSQTYSNDNINATLATTGRDGVPGAPGASGAGGVGPAGALRPTNLGYSWGDQGAGFTGNGQWSERTGSSANVAKSFQNGGTGSLNTDNSAPGGFGGGGAGNAYGQGAGGGGGGYGGGGSGSSDGAGSGGGGGGSYNITGTYTGTATNSGTGYVTITKV